MSRPTASREARGYGREHKRLRAALLPQAIGKPCARCGQPMLAGQPLDLDHNDDRTGYLGFSHSFCNRRAAGRKSGRLRRTGRNLGTVSRQW